MASEIVLKYCSSWITAPPHTVDLHIHKYWELVYYTGIGISTVNEMPFNYIPGSYVIIPPEVSHSEKSLSEGKVYCLGFETSLNLSMLPNTLLFDDEEKSLRKRLDIMMGEVKEEQPFFAERMNVLLHDLLLLTMRKFATKKRKSDRKMNMIINYIDAYYTMDIDFKAMANSLNYSYDYLRHYFKTHTQTSLKQYVIQRRIVLAKKLLIYQKPIAEVAQECGFSTPAHFSEVFRQTTGMTPSEYRDRHNDLRTSNETHYV